MFPIPKIQKWRLVLDSNFARSKSLYAVPLTPPMQPTGRRQSEGLSQGDSQGAYGPTLTLPIRPDIGLMGYWRQVRL